MFNFVVRSLPNVVSQNIISTVFRVGAWAAVKQRGEKFHSIPRLVILPGMDVKIIPALQDNYMYLIVDNETKEAAVVDPVEPEHVLAELKGKDIKLTKILTTHHHCHTYNPYREVCEVHSLLDRDDCCESTIRDAVLTRSPQCINVSQREPHQRDPGEHLWAVKPLTTLKNP
ncbi:probable hydrolase PNKD [Macrosteles quadrilineatus]|uniref:probable hydrolase PNKD n=1 Tax=Macrosteles quadrilineatus TaxID=74068 RepID=UPI0023E0FA0B|nr:probable hydrolase PNKD [Macrosteles quadrilineatus]